MWSIYLCMDMWSKTWWQVDCDSTWIFSFPPPTSSLSLSPFHPSLLPSFLFFPFLFRLVKMRIEHLTGKGTSFTSEKRNEGFSGHRLALSHNHMNESWLGWSAVLAGDSSVQWQGGEMWGTRRAWAEEAASAEALWERRNRMGQTDLLADRLTLLLERQAILVLGNCFIGCLTSPSWLALGQRVLADWRLCRGSSAGMSRCS